jgi:PhoD-like phosphatase
MTSLVLGPLLRCVGSTPEEGGSATVWVETAAPCEVEVQAGDVRAATRTFTVAGHHYALVLVAGLPERGETPYEVTLDGACVWPALPDWPASVIRTRRRTDPVQLAFGSCRVAGPLDDPERGVDALHALAAGMRVKRPQDWPDELLLVGDQVYADENISPQTQAFIAGRRDTTVGAGPQVADVEEYCQLYRESWTPDPVRWLLSTVPSAMVFDDHDIHDDWNTSSSWRAGIKKTDWWQDRIEAGLMTYWLYQHLGNLDPAELADNALLKALQEESRDGGDGEQVLRAYARQADAEADGGGPTRWSFVRPLGTSRLLVLDSRCGRVLDDDRREMLDEPEWTWVGEQVRGDHDHLLVATTLPWLLPPGVHHLEAFDEALAGGVWGDRAARVGEALRQAADLEHWAAFGTSFERMGGLVADVAAGEHGRPPATVTFLSGDVHFAYLAETRRSPAPGATRVFQAVCSPLRNPLPGAVKVGQSLACTRLVGGLGRAMAKAVRVARPAFDWRITGGPAFGNEVATLDLDGRRAVLTVLSAVEGPHLVHAFARQLS